MCDEPHDLLVELNLLKRCTPAERRAIVRTADYLHVERGTRVSCAQEGINPIVIVAHGELCVISGDGVTTMREGSVVGAAEILARQPRHGHVVAATDADLFLIEPRRFLPLVERCPNFAVGLLRALARESLAAPA
jgi:CRP-like cAMP-binding protein